MRHSFPTSLVSASVLAVVIAALLLSWVPVFAQAAESQTAMKAAPTRVFDGRPDLQGIWGFATVTPLQRPKEFADREVLTPDTLVVETRNFRSEGTGTLSLRGLGLSGDENLHLIERFRRLDTDTLLYEYTIDDPTIWTRPWTVSMTMRKSDEQMYEYACHEGNYGLFGILAGARAEEKVATGAVKKTGSR